MELINDNMENALTNQIKNEAVDLILSDLPYNISDKAARPVWKDPSTGEDKNSIHDQKFDALFEDDWDTLTHREFIKKLNIWAQLWYPKLRKGGSFALFISDKYISHLWDALENAGFEPKRLWTWKKPNAVPFNRKVNPVSGCEYIIFGIKPGGKRTFNSDAVPESIVDRFSLADKVSSILYKHIKQNGSDLNKSFKDALSEAKIVQKNLKSSTNINHCVIPNTITFGGGAKNKIHPTQKPTEILEYFISLLSNKNDLVLDTFAGSGSTGVACGSLNRRAILIEQDKEMFKAMSKNINDNSNTTFNTLFSE